MTTVLVLPVKCDPDQSGVEEPGELELCRLRKTPLVTAAPFNLGCVDVEEANFDLLVPERVTVNDASDAALVRMTFLPEDVAVVRYGQDRSDHDYD